MQHQLDESQIDERLGRLRQTLVILGEAAVAAGPGDGTLDDPTFGQHDKALLSRFLADNLDLNVKVALDPLDKLTLIGAVGKELLKARIAPSEVDHDPFATFTVGNISAMHENPQQQTHGINEEVPVATNHPFFPR